MPNLLFISNQDFFKNDLQKQIELYAPEFKPITEDERPDVILSDEQTDQLRYLKEKYPHIPFVVLLPNGTEKPAPLPLVTFLIKPLRLNTFLDELRASINLSNLSDAVRLKFNGYELNPLNKEITLLQTGETIKLTEKEVAVIQYLYTANDRFVSKNELLSEVWGYNPDATTHTIETHIYRLRQKVEHNDTDAPFILTEDGGYILKK